MKPNFIFIGPDKTGSTWLWKMLRQHPEVYVSPAKDIYFFDRYYDLGATWYESHFRGAEQKIAIGDLSHDYLMSETACDRIRSDLPDVKLITMLRNPIDRAFSEYLYLRKHSLIDGRATLREAALQFPSIVQGGMYARHLGNYLRVFGHERLFIGDYEDIAIKPAELISRICTFLGVDSGFQFAGLQDVILPAAAARNAWLAKRAKGLAVRMRDLGFGNLVGMLKHSRMIQVLMYREYGARDKPKLTAEDAQWLWMTYMDDMEKLEALLQRSFRHWRKARADA